jgi:2-haloacid dehalogenase
MAIDRLYKQIPLERMKIKNIIFDFGGVLIDWDPRYMYRNVFADDAQMEWFLQHICSHDWNIQQDAGRTLEKGTTLLVKSFPEHEKMIRLFYDRWEDMLNGPIEANVQLLQPLRDKYRLLGLTNWSAETFPIALEKYSFLNEFEGIVVSGVEKLIKPDPAIYELLLKRYKIAAPESLFIDDNQNNIEAANKLGFQTIHFTEQTALGQKLNHLGLL